MARTMSRVSKTQKSCAIKFANRLKLRGALPMEKKNPVALVTGVGPGTGAAIARRFSRGGYSVAMLARNRERLARLKDEIPNSHAYQCDVTNEAQLDTSIEAIRAELGAPKVLIHHAVGGESGH